MENIKTILMGCEASKEIIQASSYLIKKYASETDFLDFYFLNYGSCANCQPLIGTFVSIADYESIGGKKWSSYLRDFLDSLTDEYIILALDDFFISRAVNLEEIKKGVQFLVSNPSVLNVKLSMTPSLEVDRLKLLGASIYELGNDIGYKSSTQYTIWRRSMLVELLAHTSSPWNFETSGTAFIEKKYYRRRFNRPFKLFWPPQKLPVCTGMLSVPFSYPEISALSSANPDYISVFGNNFSDIERLIDLGLLEVDRLVMGHHFLGEKLYFSDYGRRPLDVLAYIDVQHRRYYQAMLNCCLKGEAV